MSPKDNNKQVSAAVRILQQKRDASARATHLMVKNDSLITYEKAFEGQAAVKKFFIATFLERKKMSTKTSFKRIALVAAAALAIGGFSAVSPANAANSVPTVGTATSNVVLGATATTTIGLTMVTTTGTTIDSGSSVTLSVPSGSSVTLADNNGATAGATAMFDNATGQTGDIAATVNTSTGAIGGDSGTEADAAVDLGTMSVIPDVQGTYTITVTAGGTTAVATINASDLWAEIADGVTNGDQSDLTANGVAGANNTVKLSVRVQAAGTPRSLSVVGAGSKITSVGTAADFTIAEDKSSAVLVDAAGGANDGTVTISTPQAGEITVYLYKESQSGIYSSTPIGKVVITVGTTAINGTISATTSTAVMTASGTGTLSADALSLTGASTASATIGSIAVTLNRVSGACSATNVATISTTKGILTVSSGATNGTGTSLAEIGDCAFDVAIKGDGTTGAATVTITSGAYTATRSVTFYGSAKTIVATQVLKRASTAGATLGSTASAAAAAVTLVVTDSTGNPVAGVTPTAVSADTAVISGGACSASTSKGASYCSVTSAANTAGKTASVTFKTTVSGVDVVSNALTFTLGGALSTYSWAFDKAEYSPGELMTINITGKDSKGNPSFDGSVDIFDTAITTSTPVTNTWTDALTGIDFVDGKASIEIYAPLIAGPFSLTAGVASGLTTAMGATSVSLTTALSGGAAVETASLALDAANAATDAANNAYDEAQNATQAASDALAAVTALAAQVKSLIASVKKLTAAVAKLKK